MIEKQFAEVAGNYIGIPGLVRKYFCYSEDARSVAGIYLWKSKALAAEFYSPQWMAGVKERWGAEPVRTEWTVPLVTESEEGVIVIREK